MTARRVAFALLAAVGIFNAFLLLGAWAPVPSLWLWAALAALVPAGTVLLVDPATLRDRRRSRRRGIDTARMRLAQGGQTVMYIVGPLDVGRLHWTDSVPEPLRYAAFPVLAAGLALVTWSMRANRFFMPQVRIQEERGHQVVAGGPYRFVRHPGYAGMIVVGLTSGIALGSWLAFLVGLVPAVLFAFRAKHEDAFLRAHLAGYAEFTTHTRYRLVPGVW